MSNLYSRWCTDCLVSLGYIPHIYLARMEHQIHRTTPPHTLPIFYLWFFLHNRQCSPNSALSLALQYPSTLILWRRNNPPDRMPNQICTSHIAKIRRTTHRISRSQHALRVKKGDIIKVRMYYLRIIRLSKIWALGCVTSWWWKQWNHSDIREQNFHALLHTDRWIILCVYMSYQTLY